MSYVVELEPLARAAFERLLPPVQAAVARVLLSLGASPSAAGTRGTPPTYAPGQLLRTSVPGGGVTCQLDIIFRYGQDETTLWVSHIYVEYD